MDFLSTLFGDKPNDLYVLIWTPVKKRSAWFRDLDQARTYVGNISHLDAYVHVGLSSSDYGPSHRCGASDVAGIAGLWVDLDIADPAHQKPNLPPTQEDALGLLAGLPEPSLTVHSGHGLQLWWLFKELWLFESDAERSEAAELAARWQGTIRQRARVKGWDVDATADLARLLRIPGTTNRKGKPPVEVRLIGESEARYNPSDFDEYLVDVTPTTAPSSGSKAGGALVLEATADPPFGKFEALSEIESKFRLSWERKRKDLQDQSGSSYDMSLACYAVMASWSDQEMANLLIAHRRKHGDDVVKALRQDYMRLTIDKARQTIAKSRAVEAIDEMAVGVGPEPENRRQAILDNLSALFEVKITRVVKFTSDPPEYRLETELGTIHLGEVGNLIGQPQLRTKIAAASGRYLPRFKNERWDRIAQALLDACEEETLGEDATAAGAARGWLTSYLARHKPVQGIANAVEQECPFVHLDARTYLFGKELRRWLGLYQGEKITAKLMGTCLRAAGCEPETVAVSVDGRETTRQVWRLPLIGGGK